MMREDDEIFQQQWSISAAVRYIVERGFKRVTLQFPDELLLDAPLVADKLREELAPLSDAQVYILADTTYNPMAVDEVAAEHVNADCVIHFGPASLGPVTRVPALCLLPRAPLDVDAASQLLATALGDACNSLDGDSGADPQPAAAVLLHDQAFDHALPRLRSALAAAYHGPLKLVHGHMASCVLDPPPTAVRYCHAAGTPRAATPADADRVQGAGGGGGGCACKPGAGAAQEAQRQGGETGCTSGADTQRSAVGSAAGAECAAPCLRDLTTEGAAAAAAGGCAQRAPATTSEAGTSDSAPIGGLTWRLPPGVAPSQCLWLWLGPPDSPCLAALQLTLSACRWCVVTPGAASPVQLGVSPAVTRLLKRRYYLVEKARGASIVGILVGTLATVGYLDAIQKVKQLARQSGKHTYTALMGRPNPAKLGNFPEVEVWVHVADPLGLVLDCKEYLAPLITPYEALLAFTAQPLDYATYRLDYEPLLGYQLRSSPVSDGTDSGGDEDGVGMQLATLPGGLQLAARTSGISNGRGVVAVRDAAEYLQLKRSYKGLETPATGAQVAAAHMAQEGRRGRAAAYADEPALPAERPDHATG